MNETIWKFETANFTVIMTAEEEYDLDLSFDEDGSVREAIEDGEFVVFCAKCAVLYRGAEIGTDYLGGCIYRSTDEFRDHIGISKPAMAKRAKRDIAEATAAFVARTAYLKGRFNRGEIDRRYYSKSMRDAREAAAEARANFTRTMCLVRSRGEVGSYFSSMVREAIREARESITDMPRMRAA